MELPDPMRTAIVLVPLLLASQSAPAATAAGPGALALAALVAAHSPPGPARKARAGAPPRWSCPGRVPPASRSRSRPTPSSAAQATSTSRPLVQADLRGQSVNLTGRQAHESMRPSRKRGAAGRRGRLGAREPVAPRLHHRPAGDREKAAAAPTARSIPAHRDGGAHLVLGIDPPAVAGSRQSILIVIIRRGLACRVGCAISLCKRWAGITGSRLARARHSRARLAGITAHMHCPAAQGPAAATDSRTAIARCTDSKERSSIVAARERPRLALAERRRTALLLHQSSRSCNVCVPAVIGSAISRSRPAWQPRARPA